MHQGLWGTVGRHRHTKDDWLVVHRWLPRLTDRAGAERSVVANPAASEVAPTGGSDLRLRLQARRRWTAYA
jgi:hypothetical protein